MNGFNMWAMSQISFPSSERLSEFNFQDTPFAHVAIAGQGGKLSDIKSVAIQSVLCGVIGKGF